MALAIFSLSTIFPNFANAADEDYDVLSQVSEDKCINILVDTGNDTGNQKFYYNGNVVDVPADYVAIKDVQIGGDRLGFVAWKGANNGTGEVFVDDQVVGSVIDWPAYNPDSDYLMVVNADYQLKINDKHVAYLRIVGLKSIDVAKAAAGYKALPVFHVIFDNQDLGEILAGERIKLNGDYVIFRKYINNHFHIFANNKDLGIGNHGNFDGKNIAI